MVLSRGLAIVTGAGGSLGKALTVALTNRSVSVLAVDLPGKGVQEGEGIINVELDVTDWDAVSEFGKEWRAKAKEQGVAWMSLTHSAAVHDGPTAWATNVTAPIKVTQSLYEGPKGLLKRSVYVADDASRIQTSRAIVQAALAAPEGHSSREDYDTTKAVGLRVFLESIHNGSFPGMVIAPPPFETTRGPQLSPILQWLGGPLIRIATPHPSKIIGDLASAAAMAEGTEAWEGSYYLRGQAMQLREKEEK